MGRIMGRVLPPLIVLVLLFLPALIIAQETPTPAPGSGATRFGDMAIEFGEMAPEGLLTDIQVGSVFQTAEGESVRAIRLSDNMVLMTVVGESGSTGDTLVVTAPPDVIVELSLGDLWDKVKGAARDAISAVADAVLDGGGSGGSGGGQNCSQTTEIEMDGRGGIKTIRVTQSCTPA